MTGIRTSAFRFGLVGVSAMAVHLCAATGLMSVGATPVQANFLGYLVAVPLSYAGHRSWSFRGGTRGSGSGFLRFVLTSAVGFAANQLLFPVVLAFTGWSPAIALSATLLLVATATFIACRWWVFQLQRP